MEEIVQKIIAWAEKESSIKLVLLTGSLASKGPKDELSDYDIALFADDVEKYANDDSWIHDIGDVWVYEPCELSKDGKIYQTRLIIYEDGLQVDFSLFDLEYLERVKNKDVLPVEYNLGYKVLLDKDGLTADLKKPTYEYPYSKKPSQEEFELAIRIFFFEAFKQAKALIRKDLWHAKIRDWSIKKRLLLMIEWYEKTIYGFNYDTNIDAKRMQNWIELELWKELQFVFSRFDENDSWKGLEHTINLFRKVSIKVAEGLNFPYLHDVGKHISNYIFALRDKKR